MDRDSNAFVGVIESHKGIIYKVANAYCRNAENRKDLVQEIIIQLWLSLHKYDDAFQMSTWIYRIALNVCISFYRKENRRDLINQPVPEGILQLQETQNDPDIQHRIDLLYTYIRELNELDRGIMLLYLDGHSQLEMAQIMGLTATNVATKVSRIKKHLKQKFQTLNT